MIIWAASPAVSLMFGLSQVILDETFVCAPAMTVIPPSSAGTKKSYLIRPLARGGGDFVRPVDLVQFCTPWGLAQERHSDGDGGRGKGEAGRARQKREVLPPSPFPLPPSPLPL